MRHGSVDTSLLRQGAHSPSYFALSRSMGPDAKEKLADFCIPCNPYFPTPEMFAKLTESLVDILKYYPSDSGTITKQLCQVLRLHPQTVAMANGSTELITWIDHLLIKESVAIPIPTFGRWTDQPMETGKRVDMYPLAGARQLRAQPRPLHLVHPRARIAGRGHLQRQQPRRQLHPAPRGAPVHGPAQRPRPRGHRRVVHRLRRRRAVPVGRPRRDHPAERGGAQEPRQELRPARHPVRLHDREPGHHRHDRQGPAEVEPELAGGVRRLHAQGLRGRVPGEPAPALARPHADGRVADARAGADRLPVAGRTSSSSRCRATGTASPCATT